MRSRPFLLLIALALMLATSMLPVFSPSGFASAEDNSENGYTSDHTVVEIGPDERTAELRLPGGYDGTKKLPLVVALHGYSSDGPGVAWYLELYDSVHENGHILLLPNGAWDATLLRYWNATEACCNFYAEGPDDVEWLTSLIDEAIEQHGADPDKVLLIGHSNGGFMSHRMACERGDRIHTIISLAGATYDDFEDCAVTGYPNILNVHGTSDNIIYFDGGEISSESYPSASQTTASWAVRSGCDEEATYLGNLDLIWDSDYYETTDLEHLNCAAGNHVALWKIDGGSHSPSFPDGSLINAAFSWAMEDKKWFASHSFNEFDTDGDGLGDTMAITYDVDSDDSEIVAVVISIHDQLTGDWFDTAPRVFWVSGDEHDPHTEFLTAEMNGIYDFYVSLYDYKEGEVQERRIPHYSSMALQTFEYLDNVGAAASDTDPTIIEINGDWEFSPDPSYVLRGESVVWLHNANDIHTVTSDDGLFDSGGMDNGDAFSHTFDSLGTYSYSCSDHPGMNGTIVVLDPGFTFRPLMTNWILQEGDFLEYDPGNIMDGVLKELNMQDMEVLHLTPIRLEALADTGPGSPTGETCPDFGGQCHVIQYSIEFGARGVNDNAEEDYKELSQRYEVTVYISAPYNGYLSTHEVGYHYSSEGTASGEDKRSWRWMNETTRTGTSGAGNPATGGVPLEVSLGDNWTVFRSEETLSRSEEGCDQEVNSGVVMHSECGPWALTEDEADPPQSMITTAVYLTGIELEVHNEADPDAASPTMFPVMFILEQGVDDPVGPLPAPHTTSGLPLYWDYDGENGLTGERPLIRYSIEGEADFDNDGVMNFYDRCPDTGAGELADEDGCSWEQYDNDYDGVLNDLDSCPDTTADQSVDADGCAEDQKDDDDDGVMNDVDTCPGTQLRFPGESVDAEGCSDSQKDTDEDGVSDADDACPGHDDAIDVDEDDIPDGCDSLLDIDDGGGFGISAPSLAASVAAVAVIALHRRR